MLKFQFFHGVTSQPQNDVRPGPAISIKLMHVRCVKSTLPTALEAIMKAFAALLLLSAFAAYVSANGIYCKVVADFLEERQDEGMAQVLRDQGLPEDTLVPADHPQPPD